MYGALVVQYECFLIVTTTGTRLPAEVAAALLDEGIVLGEGALMSLVAELRREYLGLGPLDALVRQPGVTDVLVNSAHDVWIDRH